ncbi:MAG: hypothetical protein ACR2PY_05365 [Salinispira sp.]
MKRGSIVFFMCLLLIVLSACECPPGTFPPPTMHIYLLAETPQPAEIGNAPIVINTTEANIGFYGNTFRSFPECKWVPHTQQDVLSQFLELKNIGTEAIYSFASIEGNDVVSSAITDLEAQFPDFARLKYAYSHGGSYYNGVAYVAYSELLLSDEEITDPLSADAQRWTEGAEFAKAVVDELCDGEFVGCKYVTVIEPGETANIVANYFADEDW